VPETPVDEHRHPLAGEHQIGGAAQRRQRPGVDSVAQTHRVKTIPVHSDDRVEVVEYR
jgi:hypothetical protein